MQGDFFEGVFVKFDAHGPALKTNGLTADCANAHGVNPYAPVGCEFGSLERIYAGRALPVGQQNNRCRAVGARGHWHKFFLGWRGGGLVDGDALGALARAHHGVEVNAGLRENSG